MRITLLSLLLLLATGFLAIDAQKTDEFHLDQVYSIDPGGTINLESDDAEVTITGSDREDVRVIVNYKWTVRGITFGSENEFELIVEEQNGNLNIYEKPRDFEGRTIIGVTEEEYAIRIEAPRNVNLDIDGDDDDYRISGIDGNLFIDADDSDLQIRDCNGEEFSFTIDDGDLLIDCGSGRLSLDVDDGDVEIRNGRFDRIDIDSDDSDIDITTSLTDGGTYNFDLDDAELRLMITGGGGQFEIDHDDADIRASGEYELISDAGEEGYSVYRLMGGNSSVSIDSDDGEIILGVY